MKREVNFVSYLPPFLTEYPEIRNTLNAQDSEFIFVWEAAERVLENAFLETADEYGISRWEKLLKIYPQKTDTLETRRMRVQNRWFHQLPYTVRMLIMRIAKMLEGESYFSILSNWEEDYSLIVTVYVTTNNQVEELKYILATMVPANMVTDIVYESIQKEVIFYGVVMCEADILEFWQR